MSNEPLQPCPPSPHGGDRECCECQADIPSGVLARRNRYGQFAHATCPSNSAPRGAAGDAVQTVLSAVGERRPGETETEYGQRAAAAAGLDPGARVADAIERMRGPIRPASN